MNSSKVEEDFYKGLSSIFQVINMLSNVSFDLSVEYSEVYMSNRNSTPTKSLLFAILERAVLDLFINEKDNGNIKYKTQAIRWFLSPARTARDGFTFLQIVQNLDISSTTTNKLLELARSIQIKNGKYYDLYTRYRSRGYRCLRYLN